MDDSNNYLSTRQYSSHRQQSSVPPFLWLRTRRTSLQVSVDDDVLHNRARRQHQLCRIRLCWLHSNRGSELIIVGLRCRSLRRGLWNNGNSSRTEDRDIANLPPQSEHIRRGRDTSPSRRVSRRACPQKLLVSRK